MKITHTTYDKDHARLLSQALANQEPITVDAHMAGGLTKAVEAKVVSINCEAEKRERVSDVRQAYVVVRWVAELYIREFDVRGVEL